MFIHWTSLFVAFCSEIMYIQIFRCVVQCKIRSSGFLASYDFFNTTNVKAEPITKHDQNIFAISIVNDLSFCIFVILSIKEGKK